MLVAFHKTGRHNRPLYYSIDDRQSQLFSTYFICTTWGGSPQTGRQKNYYFETQAQKDSKIRLLIKQKQKEGYRVLYTYFREATTEEQTEEICAYYGLA